MPILNITLFWDKESSADVCSPGVPSQTQTAAAGTVEG